MKSRYSCKLATHNGSHADCRDTHSEIGFVTDPNTRLRAYFIGGENIWVEYTEK